MPEASSKIVPNDHEHLADKTAGASFCSLMDQAACRQIAKFKVQALSPFPAKCSRNMQTQDPKDREVLGPIKNKIEFLLTLSP